MISYMKHILDHNTIIYDIIYDIMYIIYDITYDIIYIIYIISYTAYIGSIWRVIGSGYCFSTFLLCFALWLGLQPAPGAACPASTSTRWPTYWGAPLSIRASSAAAVTPLSHTASRTIGVLDTPPPIRSGTRATAAGSTPARWTSGCSTTAGTAPGWCLLLRRRGSGPTGSARTGPGRQRRGSVAARPLPHCSRSGGGARRRRSWLNTGLWYHRSYHK